MNTINVAILSDGIVVDVSIFTEDDFETAQDFLKNGIWENADDVQVLPEGFGIGDEFNGTDWTKKPNKCTF